MHAEMAHCPRGELRAHGSHRRALGDARARSRGEAAALAGRWKPARVLGGPGPPPARRKGRAAPRLRPGRCRREERGARPRCISHQMSRSAARRRRARTMASQTARASRAAPGPKAAPLLTPTVSSPPSAGPSALRERQAAAAISLALAPPPSPSPFPSRCRLYASFSRWRDGCHPSSGKHSLPLSSSHNTVSPSPNSVDTCLAASPVLPDQLMGQHPFFHRAWHNAAAHGAGSGWSDGPRWPLVCGEMQDV